MPIFDFICKKCATTKEMLIRPKDVATKIVCDMCLNPMEKVLSVANFQLIGEGFYKPSRRTDNET